MVLLSVLSNILVSLEPFTRGHRDMFSEEVMAPFLDGVDVQSDEDRVKVRAFEYRRDENRKAFELS